MLTRKTTSTLGLDLVVTSTVPQSIGPTRRCRDTGKLPLPRAIQVTAVLEVRVTAVVSVSDGSLGVRSCSPTSSESAIGRRPSEVDTLLDPSTAPAARPGGAASGSR